jgi:acetyl esterase/lipase
MTGQDACSRRRAIDQAACGAVALLLAAMPCECRAAAGEKPTPQRRDIGVTTTVQYCEAGGQPLYMDIFVPDSAAAATTPSAAVIYVHGGGWAGGDRTDGFEFMRQTVPLREAGFVVASIDYRLFPKHLFPAQIEDAKCAVRWLRANAAKYHVDPNRIGALGESAGGHLVSLLGLARKDAGLEGEGGNPEVSSEVQAVANLYGVGNIESITTGSFLAPVLTGVFAAPGAWKRGSPVNYVRTEAPPFLVIHGDKDAMVPVEQSRELVARMREAGMRVKYIEVKNANHGFWPVGGDIAPTLPEITSEIVEFFRQTLR